VTPERTLEAAPTPRRRQWADLMRRSFGFDVLACDRCGGRLRLIALIQREWGRLVEAVMGALRSS
jgi:hypothetical protein